MVITQVKVTFDNFDFPSMAEYRGRKVAQILRDLADRMDEKGLQVACNERLKDSDGNKVGFCQWEGHDDYDYAGDDPDDGYARA
jgi:hypothetical protein